MATQNLTNEAPVKEQGVLRQHLILLYRKLWILILATVLGAMMGLGANYIIAKPTYTATETVLLVATLDDNAGNSSSAQTNATLAEIFLPETAMLIRSPFYIQKANEKLQTIDTTDYGTVRAGAIGVNVSDTLIFKISYTDASPEAALAKLRAVITTAEEYLSSSEYGIHATEVVLKTTQNPGTNVVTKNSELAKFMIIGAAIGLILSAAIVLFINALDNTVKSKEDLEDLTGISVIAYIEDRDMTKATTGKSK